METFHNWFKNTKPTIVYLTVGYPSFEESIEIARFILKNGFASIIEAGIPFSDPIADGQVIQFSTQKALQNGITIRDVAKFVKLIRSEFDSYVFAMGYYNPIFTNLDSNLRLLSDSGCSGVIIPDINVEEIRRIKPFLKKYGLKIVGFVAPNTTDDRIRKIVKETDGFIYLVSSYGTTGIRDNIDFIHLKDVVMKIKEVKDLPVAIGFGIRDINMIKKAKEVSDGAIVGSAIIKIVEDNPSNYLEKIREFFGGSS